MKQQLQFNIMNYTNFILILLLCLKTKLICRKPLARLTDSVEKQFSALSGNEDKIIEYAHRYISQ